MSEVATAAATVATPTGWWSTKVAPMLSWKRTSLSILALVEQKIFSGLKQPFEGYYVPIDSGQKRIWTVSMNTKSPNTPLVMLHGMGSGVGLWVLNLDSVCRNRPVYALDVLGFGRSSRTKFDRDPKAAEQEFIDSVEEWRKAMKLGKIILLGHSLGGYLSACYSMQHPQQINHLILVDPWGLPQRPDDGAVRRDVPVWVRVISTVIEPFNPFAPLRALGPWGPSIIAKIRSDLIRKFEHIFSDNRIADYLYHCNAQNPSGETAFKSMMHQFGWAKNPLLPRIDDIPAEVSMTLIHGSRSWVDYSVGYQVKYNRPDSVVDVQVIQGAGHHVYADKPELFNELVNRACDKCDRSIANSDWYVPASKQQVGNLSSSQGIKAVSVHDQQTANGNQLSNKEDAIGTTDCNANPMLGSSVTN